MRTLSLDHMQVDLGRVDVIYQDGDDVGAVRSDRGGELDPLFRNLRTDRQTPRQEPGGDGGGRGHMRVKQTDERARAVGEGGMGGGSHAS